MSTSDSAGSSTETGPFLVVFLFHSPILVGGVSFTEAVKVRVAGQRAEDRRPVKHRNG